MPSALPSLPDRRTCVGILVAFAVAALLVYGGVARHGFVRWDDGMLITENPAVREIAPWSIAWVFSHFDPELYIPLTFLTYQVDFQLGNGAAWPFHVGNLVLHTINALLAAWLALLLLRRRWAALLVGTLFLLHPLHTEAVAWASARKDVLSTMFFFGAFIAELFADDRQSRRLHWFAVGIFLLGLLSKVMVATLPVLLFLVHWRDGTLSWKEEGRRLWPYVVLSTIFGAVAIFGKEHLVAATSQTDKVLMAARSTAFYVQQIFVPTGFSLLYPYTGAISLRAPVILWSAIVVLAAAVTAIVIRRRTRWPLFLLGFYVLSLAPTFVNFSKGSDLDIYFASDRYAYIPSFAIFLLVALLLDTAVRRLPRLRLPIVALAVLAPAGLALLSFRQLQVWQTTESLFRNVIALYPASSHVAYNNLGNAERLQGNLAVAEDYYNQALAIRPHAKTLSNLGAAYRQEGRLTEAHDAYARALALDPQSQFAHFGLGIVLMQEGRFGEAEAQFRTTMQLAPDYKEAPTNLGVLFAKQNRWQDAVDAYTIALSRNPFYPDARYNLAIALDELGQTDAAMEQYAWVIRLAPRFIAARMNYGILLANAGKRDASIAQFKAILQIDPGNAAAREALRQLGEEG